MMISMPIWMLLLFLAAAMVAGLAAALLWVNFTDLKKIRKELNYLTAQKHGIDAKEAINYGTLCISRVSTTEVFVHLTETHEGLEAMVSDKRHPEESRHIYIWNKSGMYESNNGLNGPWKKKEPEREDTHQ